MSNLTPWFSAEWYPKRRGFYQVQDTTMRCGCCWFVAHWNGREWHTDLTHEGLFNVLLFTSRLKRWRGLTEAAYREALRKT